MDCWCNFRELIMQIENIYRRCATLLKSSIEGLRETYVGDRLSELHAIYDLDKIGFTKLRVISSRSAGEKRADIVGYFKGQKYAVEVKKIICNKVSGIGERRERKARIKMYGGKKLGAIKIDDFLTELSRKIQEVWNESACCQLKLTSEKYHCTDKALYIEADWLGLKALPRKAEEIYDKIKNADFFNHITLLVFRCAPDNSFWCHTKRIFLFDWF